VEANRALNGGGIYAAQYSQYVKIYDADLIGNSATRDGGGVYVLASTLQIFAPNTNLMLNTAGGSGGGVFNAVGDVTVFGSTLAANKATQGSGGGIYTTGTVTIATSIFSGNTADASRGGAIANLGSGEYTVTESLFLTNTAQQGGAIADVPTQAFTPIVTRIAGSTFVDNDATTTGGALYYLPSNGRLTLVNSTFSSNSTAGSGGAIYNGGGGGSMAIAHTTFYANAGGSGATIFNNRPLALTNSILTDSIDLTVGDPDTACAGSVLLTGTGNLIGIESTSFHDTSCGTAAGFNAGWVTEFDTLLRNNQGPTWGALDSPMLTHALGTGVPRSNAIDHVASCLDPDGNLLAFDQRRASRPQGGRCDAGAVEQQ
jgi:predicted outer membrane repeat protein